MKNFRRALLSLGMLLTYQQVHAKEIQLDCIGVEVFSEKFVPTSKSQTNYSVVFNDVKKTVSTMTVGLAIGCFKDDYVKSTKCDCKVTEREISCESATVGIKNPLASSQQSFVINRFSGKMRTSRSMTGKNPDGQDVFYTTDGDLLCEAMTTKKF
jgi:hypothetical protein